MEEETEEEVEEEAVTLRCVAVTAGLTGRGGMRERTEVAGCCCCLVWEAREEGGERRNARVVGAETG